MTSGLHPAASPHLPPFITAPGETDILYVLVALVLIGAVLGAGVFFFWLHSLPERMVHNKVQFDLVAVLALLSLFTHIHAFWVAALLLALIDLPKFSFPHFSRTLSDISHSLEKIASRSIHDPGPNSDTRSPAASGVPSKRIGQASVAPDAPSPGASQTEQGT